MDKKVSISRSFRRLLTGAQTWSSRTKKREVRRVRFIDDAVGSGVGGQGARSRVWALADAVLPKVLAQLRQCFVLLEI